VYRDLDEQALAMRCSQKDRLAGDELYRRYAVKVYTLCKRYLGDEDDAKDLMLDTLVQALDKIDTYRYMGEGSLGRWIGKIAINKALSQIRKQRWLIIPLDGWMKDKIPEPREEEMETIPGEKIQEWIAELPGLRRAVFNLYCLDGYSHQEIGKMLGISERGSTSTLAKARRQLKEKIRQYLKERDR
jgi:RNA polymerase sigma-70 factor (ECF subfamily)